MKIIKLKAENVKRLKAVEITPDGAVVVIGGNNAQGKSSVLDSIQYALGGKRGVCEKPIRDGQTEARILLKTEEFTLKWSASQTGGSLVIENANGKVKSPQALLDSLYNEFSFDPLAFTRMSSKEQVETMKRLAGLDFTAIDNEWRRLYDARTEANREARSLAIKRDAMGPEVAVDQDTPVVMSDLIIALSAATEHNQEIDGVNDAIFGEEKKIHDLETALANMKERLASLRNRREELGEKKDTAHIKDQITNSEALNARIRNKQQRKQLTDALAKLQSEIDAYTTKLESLAAQKANALSSAIFPITGICFDQDTMNYNGQPFSQCSSAEQLKVSLAMGLAMNPKLPVVLIRDGSLLDENSLKMIAEMAAEKNAQVWIERVGKGAECQVIIEDGMVSE